MNNRQTPNNKVRIQSYICPVNQGVMVKQCLLLYKKLLYNRNHDDTLLNLSSTLLVQEAVPTITITSLYEVMTKQKHKCLWYRNKQVVQCRHY